MKLQKARKKIHEMRSSISVISNFLGQLDVVGADQKEFLTATITSVKKLNGAVEDLSSLVHADLIKRKQATSEVLG